MNLNPQAMLRRLVVAVIAGLLGAGAAALGLLALYTYAVGMLNPLLAAVVTAGGALTLGGLILLGGRCCRTVHRGARRGHSANPEEVGDMLAQLLRHNAKKATVAALVAGVALGVSPSLRRSLIKLLRDFGKFSSSE